MHTLTRLILMLSLALVPGTLFAQAPKAQQRTQSQEEVDHLALAAMLARDGHDDRARVLLSQVDLKRPGVDLKLYHTLSGVLALKVW